MRSPGFPRQPLCSCSKRGIAADLRMARTSQEHSTFPSARLTGNGKRADSPAAQLRRSRWGQRWSESYHRTHIGRNGSSPSLTGSTHPSRAERTVEHGLDKNVREVVTEAGVAAMYRNMTAARVEGDGVTEVADGVSSVPGGDVPGEDVPDEDFDGVETAPRCDAAATPAPDPVAELAESVGELAEQVRAHHARAQARERVIDQLHLEVERLRVGEQGLLLRPVVTDLQRLRADLLHQARTLSPRIDQEQAAALLESFALSVELALERCGSLPIRPSVGAEFSAREHRAVKLVAASSPAEDDTVAVVVADGYLDASTGRVTVPARVHVRRWTPPDESPTAEPPTEEPPTDEPPRADDARLSERKEDNADV